MSDAGSERGGSAGPRKPGFFEGDPSKVRDFSNWERKGPLSPAPAAGPPVRDGGRLREGGAPRSQSPAWGEGRSDQGSRPPRREFEPRPVVERAPTAAEQDNQWRAGMKPDASPAPTPDVSTPSSPQQQAPKERPRLNLQKRTVSNNPEDAALNSASDAKASPFGAARPVDTATKEREVEEKRQIAIRERKEAEDKEREEKVAKEAAARQSRADRADKGQAQQDEQVTSPVSETGNKGRRASRQQNGTKSAPKENSETPSQSKPSFSILSRDAEGEEAAAEEDEETDDVANGASPNVKPKEPVIEVTKNANEGAAQNVDTSAEKMEDDGWSTVTSKPKNKGRGGARAIAS